MDKRVIWQLSLFRRVHNASVITTTLNTVRLKKKLCVRNQQKERLRGSLEQVFGIIVASMYLQLQSFAAFLIDL